jgi:hypothetical protein
MPKPVIHYHKTYFVDGPPKRRHWSGVLFYHRIDKRGRRRPVESMEFVGDTRDEMEAKLVEWLEQFDGLEYNTETGKVTRPET